MRTFDEDVVNPFLKDAQIPSSKGPYLAMFRRGWDFTREYEAKVRDKDAHAAFMNCMDHLESLSTPDELRLFVRELIHRFWKMREAAAVPIVQIKRLSLPQCDVLISGLLSVPSGGRLPVLITQAMFETIKRHFGLDWTVECQGINVADAASGAGGDITIKSGERIVMAAEVTERLVDRNRLVSTFKSKIAPAGIEDYLFLTKHAAPDPEAQRLAEQYFAQGHEINFCDIQNWIVNNLATLGIKGREVFKEELQRLISGPDVPKTMKVAWNERVAAAIA